TANNRIQTIAPDNLRGRVMALYAQALIGVGPIGSLQAGVRQALNPDGWQQERYPTLDPHAMALDLVDQARVQVELAGTPLIAQLWRAQVGRVPLYLLDADVDDNDLEQRHVTDRLYAGASEHRLRQEIPLGMGGVRALDALGLPTQVFHPPEGHAGLLALDGTL